MKVKQDAPDPEEDESHGEFMDRCISEMTSDDENLDESEAEEACQIAWDEQRSAAGVVHKTHAGEVKGMTFVLSDQSVDRMGDIIMADGWKLSNFKRNPIALGFHRNDFVEGRAHRKLRAARSARTRAGRHIAPHRRDQALG